MNYTCATHGKQDFFVNANYNAYCPKCLQEAYVAFQEMDAKRYAEAPTLEVSIEDFRRDPKPAFEANRKGKRVVIIDTDGRVAMRFSPIFEDEV